MDSLKVIRWVILMDFQTNLEIMKVILRVILKVILMETH